MVPNPLRSNLMKSRPFTASLERNLIFFLDIIANRDMIIAICNGHSGD